VAIKYYDERILKRLITTKNDGTYKYRYRLWADECSQLFGGLDVLAIQAVQAKDGREYIIDVSIANSFASVQYTVTI